MVEGMPEIPRTCFTASASPGDNALHQLSTAVHILPVQHFERHLSTGTHARNIPRHNREDADFSTLFHLSSTSVITTFPPCGKLMWITSIACGLSG